MRQVLDERSSLLLRTFEAMDAAGIRWCLLHGYETYPDLVPSDVDVIVHPADFARVPATLFECPGFEVVQARAYEASSVTYTLATRNAARDAAGTPAFLQFDVSRDIRGSGRILFGAEEFLGGSRRHEGRFWVPAPDVEFVFYLTKKILKGVLPDVGDTAGGTRLGALFREDPEGCGERLADLLPEKEAGIVLEAARSDRWDVVRDRVASIRGALLGKAGRARPAGGIRYLLDDLGRRARRVLKPPGFAVAFLGADGSGKTTVMDRVERDLAPAFTRTAQYRLRPGMPKRGGGRVPVTDPYALPSWNAALSLVKLGVWLADYTLGYLLRVRPRLARSTFVLFDRYYQDLLVDPARYRYGGPLWLARLVGRFVLRPDLYVFLDAPVEVLRARKREVPTRETARQRTAYLELARGLPNALTVDSSRPLDEILAEVEQTILDYMAERLRQRSTPGGRSR